MNCRVFHQITNFIVLRFQNCGCIFFVISVLIIFSVAGATVHVEEGPLDFAVIHLDVAGATADHHHIAKTLRMLMGMLLESSYCLMTANIFARVVLFTFLSILVSFIDVTTYAARDRRRSRS